MTLQSTFVSKQFGLQLHINELIIECCSFWVKNIGSGATFIVQFIHLHSTVHVSVLDKKLMKKNCNETCSEK